MSSPDPIDLALGEDEQDHPRRLLLLGNQLVAFGGDHGTLSVLDTSSNQATVARTFDDAIRAVAVSHDGKRVAVGFEDGSTQIFSYKNVPKNEKHPFLTPSTASNDDDDDDLLMSQSDGPTVKNNDDHNMFPGPRLDTPIRHLEFDPRSYHLCIASESGVCIVDATSPTTLKERFLQDMSEREHDASGIRGVSYSSSTSGKVFLATLAMDGRLCVWDVTGDDPSIDYELEHRDAHKCIDKPDIGEIHGADVCDRSSLPLFCDSTLVLPGMSDVQLRKVSDFKKQLFLSSVGDCGHVDTIVAMAASPDSKHLVTSGRDGRVILWSLDSEDDDSPGEFVCQIGQYDSIPTHFLWREHKGEEVLYMACANGTLVSIVGRDKIVPESSSESQEEDLQLETQPPPGHQPSTKAREESQQDDDDDKLETQPPPGHKRISKASLQNDDSDDDVDFDAGASTNKERSKFVNDEAEEDEDDATVAFDAPNATTTTTTEHVTENADASIQHDADDDSFGGDYGGADDDHRPLLTTKLPEPQPPFAPSSTPLDMTRRIMCWNHMGAVSYLRGDGTTRNTIDIDFTDAVTHRPISFTDNSNFILGSVGEEGAIFASDLTDDLDAGDVDDDVGKLVDGLNMSDTTKALVKRSRMNKKGGKQPTGSKIYFHRFETFGSMRDKDWIMTLPDGERATGCACGEGWAAVVTSRRFLRFFSSGGNQSQVTWLKGEPVTVVGRGRFLAVVYHESNPLPDGTQKLGYTLFDAITARVICSGSMSCISAGSQLEWAGFGNDFSLVAMDSDGMVSMLVATASDELDGAQYSWEWSPMLDTVGLRKSADDKFWPISVQDGKLVCVPLKGGNEHPDASRRPVTSTLPFHMPFTRGTLEKSSALEEISVRANLALTQKKFINEVTAIDAAEKEDLDAEYDSLCAQVDKVTLKLFMAAVEAGMVEKALDLVDRLHLEKSFDIAMTVADRLNHRTLSDHIEDKKELRFAVDEPMEDDAQQMQAFGETTPENHEDEYEEEETSTARRKISPDWNESRKSKRSMEEASDDESLDQQWGRPEKKSRVTSKKPFGKAVNPFVKKRLESPARPSVSPVKSPSKVALSRSSTFSTQSREKSKVSKRIL